MTIDSDATLLACVLIGGQSRRMGRAKHLLQAPDEPRTLLERTVARLRAIAPAVVIAGAGEVPPALERLDRIADAAGVAGPMAGIVAAMRKYPRAAWLTAACDHPGMEVEGLEWLLSQASPEHWIVMPAIGSQCVVQPLLAFYRPQALALLEEMASSGRFSLAELAQHPKTRVVGLPAHLAGSWRDVDTPEEVDWCTACG